MSTSLIDQRTIELRLLGTPEQAEELAWCEEYKQWKASGGPKGLEHKRQTEKLRQFLNTNRIIAVKRK